jgi:hypothetical protein
MSSTQPGNDRDTKGEQPLSRRLLPRAGEIVLLAVAALAGITLVTQDLDWVTRMLYSPLAFILLIVVFAEYLIIKGGDRSRLYQIEIERMREREQAHVARMRRALEELERLREACRKRATSGADDDSAEAPPADVDEPLRNVERLLRSDRKE